MNNMSYMMNMGNMMNMNNMNNMMNMGNMMMSSYQNKKNETIIKLLSQNNKLSNQIEKNNNTIMNILANPNLEADNSYEDILDQKNYIYKIINEIDFFPNYKGEKNSIVFHNNYGFGITMIIPKDTPTKEVLKAFYIKLQIFGKINSINI